MVHLKRLIWAALAINFISYLIGGGSYFLFKWVFSLEPTEIWKWTPGIPLSEMSPFWWFLLIIGNPIFAFLFAWVFATIYKGIPGEGVRKGINFGFLAWIIGVLPPLATLYLFTNIAPGALVYFTVQGLVEWLVYGAVMAAIYREGETSPAVATPLQ